MKRRQHYLLLLLVIPVLLTGCFRATRLEALCEDFAWQYPEADFRRDVSLSLGSVSLGAAKLVAGFFEDAREARQYLSGIKRIDVVSYEIRNLGDLADAELPEMLANLLDEDWEVVVKTREEDERAWILYREDDGMIRDIHITVLGPQELTMVRLSGELSETLERVLKDHQSLMSAIARSST